MGLFALIVANQFLPSLQICSLNKTSIRIRTFQCCVCGCLTTVLPLVIFLSSLEYSILCPASRPELIPTCLLNKLRCNCLSELSASLFFFSPPRTWQETHIYTQKWNYRQFESRSFGGNACYWAVPVDELLSPFALYQLVTKSEENRGGWKEKKKCIGNSGLAYRSAAIYGNQSADHRRAAIRLVAISQQVWISKSAQFCLLDC